MRHLSVVVVLSTVACGGSGSVKLDDQDPFGSISSAVWVEFKQDSIDGTDQQWHELWLSNRAGLCNDLKEVMVEIGDVHTETLGAVGANASELEYCEGYKGYWDGLGAATEPLFSNGQHLFRLDAHVPGRPLSAAPEERTYTLGYNDVDPYFFGDMLYTDVNPYAEVAEEVSCADYDWDLTPDRVLPVAQEIYELAEGTLTIEDKGASKKVAELSSGILLGPDGENAGGVTLQGTFSYCEVVFVGEAEFFLEAPPVTADQPEA